MTTTDQQLTERQRTILARIHMQFPNWNRTAWYWAKGSWYGNRPAPEYRLSPAGAEAIGEHTA